jgi:hypothetical protein
MGIGTGTSERRAKALSEIETARNAIVEVAARLRLTAAGVDTSGLADPVARIGEALTQLAALDREEAARRAARADAVHEEIRHARGGS